MYFSPPPCSRLQNSKEMMVFLPSALNSRVSSWTTCIEMRHPVNITIRSWHLEDNEELGHFFILLKSISIWRCAGKWMAAVVVSERHRITFWEVFFAFGIVNWYTEVCTNHGLLSRWYHNNVSPWCVPLLHSHTSTYFLLVMWHLSELKCIYYGPFAI